jgi:hypothetical protein
MTGQEQTHPFADLLARARLLGFHADREVGTRELLLALLADDPRGVMAAWRERGFDGHRLIEAVKEWWPSQDAAPVPVSALALPLTAGATAAVENAAHPTQGSPREALLAELLAVPAPVEVITTAGGPSEVAPADATAAALSALALL